MTQKDFMDLCASSFQGKPNADPALYLDKLNKFTNQQLDQIFSKCLEDCQYFPKIADVFETARELGFLAEERCQTSKPHRWHPTDCPLCTGEGRLNIIWRSSLEERPTGLLEIQQLVHLLPYSVHHALEPNEYSYIFRCRCLAGDAPTIPKSYPKWTNQSEPRRERWL